MIQRVRGAPGWPHTHIFLFAECARSKEPVGTLGLSLRVYKMIKPAWMPGAWLGKQVLLFQAGSVWPRTSYLTSLSPSFLITQRSRL